MLKLPVASASDFTDLVELVFFMLTFRIFFVVLAWPLSKHLIGSISCLKLAFNAQSKNRTCKDSNLRQMGP